MRKDTTPEEKLLKLIKKKKEPEPVQKPEEVKSESKASARLDGVLKSEIFKNKIFEPAVLKKINKYLVIALGVALLYFLTDLIFVRPYRKIDKIVAAGGAVEGAKPGALESKGAVMVKDYGSYSGAMAGKSVFGPYSGAAAGGESMAVSGDISERLGLVGVVTGDSPQAIIEDKKSQKTYYLNKGQSFEGYTVEDISEGKVILDSGGSKISLFL